MCALFYQRILLRIHGHYSGRCWPFIVEYSRFHFPSMSHKALCCPSWALQNIGAAKREMQLQKNAHDKQLLQASWELKKRLAPIVR